MTSRAVTQSAIDFALAARFVGITIDIEGTPTAVKVFIEDPHTTHYPERVFPSVSIRAISEVDDFENFEGDTEDEFEEVGYNDLVDPNERSMRRKPEPRRLLYSIDTWHKVRLAEHRSLASSVLTERVQSRGALTVVNIDGTAIDLWLMRFGRLQHLPEYKADYTVYHSALTVEVLAELALVAHDDTVEEKVAMTALWEIFSRKPLTGADESVTVDPADDKLLLTLRINEDGSVEVQ